MGLGYEISSVTASGPLNPGNATYISLVRLLGKRGVIRIGGNTSDYATYSANARSVSAPKGAVINESGLRDLAGFLNATGWSLIWGLNLGNGSLDDAVEEARAVDRAVGGKLLAFEIGNEPDLFVHEGHRSRYSYEEYVEQYQRYKNAVRATLPRVGFAGPDVAGATDWVERFAAQQGSDLRLLTRHYYREGQSPSSTIEKLLHPDPKLATMLQRMRAASDSSRVPYRICETNSFSGGGRPGVSDRFAAALWALDYLCVLAWHGAGGVNMETGVNQLDFISSYSPIVPIPGDPHGRHRAAPEYYGMLAFAEGCRGDRIAATYDADAMNLTAYATTDANRSANIATRIMIINKDAGADADLRIATETRAARASILRLTAASLDSDSNVRLGGAHVAADGLWRGHPESAPVTDGACRLHVPAATAAIVSIGGASA